MVLAALVAEWIGDVALATAVRTLPETLSMAVVEDWSAALPAFAAAASAFVVGRGTALPVAAEAALKMKETAALHAEAFSGADVMHGPLQLLATGLPVLAFNQGDASRVTMREAVARLRVAGGRVFTVGNPEGVDDVLPHAAMAYALLDPLPMLASFYVFAERLARERGHDPDAPSLLRKVTETV